MPLVLVSPKRNDRLFLGLSEKDSGWPNVGHVPIPRPITVSEDWGIMIGRVSIACQPGNCRWRRRDSQRGPQADPRNRPLVGKKKRVRGPVRAGWAGCGEPAGQSRAGLVLYREGGWMKQQEQSTEKEQSEKLEENQPKEPKGLRLSQDWGTQVPERPRRTCPEEQG